MATMVINRQILPAQLSSLFHAPRIAVSRPRDNGDITLSPVIDPADYDNDTDYLCAVPGMVESILAARNAPASEREAVPRLKICGQIPDNKTKD